MAKGLIAAALVCVLTGCATVETRLPDAVPVPQERVLLAPTQGDASITVVRDTGFLGGGCFFALYVNKQLAARMGPEEKLTFAVQPGEVLLGVSRDPKGQALCSADTDPTRVQRETILRPGEHKVFRMALQPSGNVDLVRSDF